MGHKKPSDHTAYQKQWRKDNPERANEIVRLSNAKIVARNRAILREFKNRPCADCLIQYPYYVMHCDHRDPSVKECNPSQLVMLKVGPDKVRAELAKCDVVCANCHAERTHRQRENQII